MKNALVLGAGTAGTIVANRLSRRLPDGWQVTLVDPAADHLYQPGLLFLPFGAGDDPKNIRPRSHTVAESVRWLQRAVVAVEPDARRVVLDDGSKHDWDVLVIASGSRIRPEETEGLRGPAWRRSIHDFYTLEGALTLQSALAGFRGGRLVLNVVEMPIKCPVAPLEFLFLADAYFTKAGVRDDVELVYATPLDGAFTKPAASRLLGSMLEEKGISVVTDFSTGSVRPDDRTIVSWDEREVGYDLLVTIPTHSGADFVESSGLGNELAFIPTEPRTLRAKAIPDAYVLGDATDLPSSKAGSVAHFQSDVVVENVLRHARGQEPLADFDGHANCFIESGHGKALMIDFNYDVEPLPGRFPLPVAGPFSLLRESRINHLGKLAFRWIYWNAMLPGRPLPVGSRMSMAGKERPAAATA